MHFNMKNTLKNNRKFFYFFLDRHFSGKVEY
jgi:hypothetical protein